MKKVIVLLLYMLLLSGCGCIMSQNPPPTQYLQVDATCGVAMPNYIPMFEYTDNCGIDTVWQKPTYGSWLTVPTTTVLLRAIDKFGNYTDLMFNVTLIDTIPPIITIGDSSMITDSRSKISSIYDLADRMLAYDELWFDANFDYEAVGIPDTLQPLQQYFNKILLTYTTPAHAFTGKGMRVHTFINESDTVLIVPKTTDWSILLRKQ